MDLSNYLKMDINILFSIINMKLRDEEGDLSALCQRYQLDAELLAQRLAEKGWNYHQDVNQFKVG
ncbi:DUF4250 domain-containing protein [Motilimonas pumila]|uniref:DUF4250 domain-containing protein n=1 Tax=Motilimonas pumila TaxID=2303987 RepID=A0A418YKU3_9GAMM|nr:DUF4250 domain-containing protein [Motilimonas pumila]RJG51602.1 DUF4250 domain-containing protein [Motilimonas pumila]